MLWCFFSNQSLWQAHVQETITVRRSGRTVGHPLIRRSVVQFLVASGCVCPSVLWKNPWPHKSPLCCDVWCEWICEYGAGPPTLLSPWSVGFLHTGYYRLKSAGGQNIQPKTYYPTCPRALLTTSTSITTTTFWPQLILPDENLWLDIDIVMVTLHE